MADQTVDIESTPLVSEKKATFSEVVHAKERGIAQFAHTLKDKGHSFTAAYVDFASTPSALRMCFFSILIYLGIGVVAFSYGFEKWTVIDSIYFSVVTFTTVGYGDIDPTTQAGQLFTTFFALFGISILGIALGILGERVVTAQEEAVEAARELSQRSMMDAFNDEDTEADEEETPAVAQRTMISEGCELWARVGMVFVRHIPLLTIIILIALIIGYYEKWTVITAIYYCMITSTTTGYGDVAPESQSMRLVAIFFIPCAVAVFGELLGRIAGIYMDMKAQEAEQKFLEKELTLSDIKVMDTDDDGEVDMAEFLSFMLVAMQKVDKESVDEIKALFNKLDVDNSGTLSKDDLIIMTKKRKNASKKKLRASARLAGALLTN